MRAREAAVSDVSLALKNADSSSRMTMAAMISAISNVMALSMSAGPAKDLLVLIPWQRQQRLADGSPPICTDSTGGSFPRALPLQAGIF